LGNNGEVHPNRPMKKKEESKAPMAREAHAEAARRNQEGATQTQNFNEFSVFELWEKEPSSFPSLPGPKQCFVSWKKKSRIWQAKEI